MEPMTLGSPSGSPATNTSAYLPSFLMGDPNVQCPQNALSPNKGGRNISFASPTGQNSPQDINRSVLGQKTLFGNHQQTPPSYTASNFNNTSIQNHNASLSGPPTQGLFDSLRNERNQVQTPIRSNQTQQYGTPIQSQNISGFGLNQSYQQANPQTSFYNDSRLNNANTTPFNISRSIMSPLEPVPIAFNNSLASSPTILWVTVFGFPNSATSTVLQHFAQCGTIVDKIFPPQNGNWVHLKYSSRVECDRALNYNEKILANNIMIGVTHCKDRAIIEKENICDSIPSTPKIRNLTQSSISKTSNEAIPVQNLSVAQKSSGIVNKAIDLFFGW